MILKRVIPFAHSLLQQATKKGDCVIDATVGNGNDTVFLADLVGPNGQVYGFDVQNIAIENTTKRLTEKNLLERVMLFEQSHDQLVQCLPKKEHQNISCAIFNLGYLPGSDKTISTHPTTTIRAVEQLLQLMRIGGLIVLVVYHGHDEGKFERDELLDYVYQLDQKQAQVLKYQIVNQINNPPFIIAIEKTRD